MLRGRGLDYYFVYLYYLNYDNGFYSLLGSSIDYPVFVLHDTRVT